MFRNLLQSNVPLRSLFFFSQEFIKIDIDVMIYFDIIHSADLIPPDVALDKCVC